MSSKLLLVVAVCIVIMIIAWWLVTKQNNDMSQPDEKKHSQTYVKKQRSKPSMVMAKKVSFSGVPERDRDVTRRVTTSSRMSPTKANREKVMDLLYSPAASIVGSDASEPQNSTTNAMSAASVKDDKGVWGVFDKPLVRKTTQKKFNREIDRQHRDYQRARGKFGRYMTDENAIISRDRNLDFNDPKTFDKLRNKSVGEVYDQQIAPIQGPELKVAGKTSRGDVAYHDDREINTGIIPNTTVKCYDADNNHYAAADFGNDFMLPA